MADIHKLHDDDDSQNLTPKERCLLCGLVEAYEHFGCPDKGVDIGMTGLKRYTGMSEKTNSVALGMLAERGYVIVKKGCKQCGKVSNIKFADRYLFSSKQEEKSAPKTEIVETEQADIYAQMDWSYT